MSSQRALPPHAAPRGAPAHDSQVTYCDNVIDREGDEWRPEFAAP